MAPMVRSQPRFFSRTAPATACCSSNRAAGVSFRAYVSRGTPLPIRSRCRSEVPANPVTKWCDGGMWAGNREPPRGRPLATVEVLLNRPEQRILLHLEHGAALPEVSCCLPLWIEDRRSWW